MLITRYIKLLFCEKSEKEFFLQLFYLLGFYPKSTFYYRKAFTHKSANNNPGKRKLCNERLEYLGDSIIDSIVADYLFIKYPKESEGFLTKMKSKIVNRKSLNQIAVELRLHTYLRSNIPNIKENDALGNAFEALVGAIYLDKGYDFTKKYLLQNIIPKYFDINFLEHTDTNYKSQLVEFVQKRRCVVGFATESNVLPDNQSKFITIISIDDVAISTGEGYTKKEAEQNASKRALEKLEN